MTQTINKNKRRAIEKVLRKRGYESFDNKPISSLTDTMLLLYITGILDLYDSDVTYYEEIYNEDNISDNYDGSGSENSNSSNNDNSTYGSGYSSSYDSSYSSSSNNSFYDSGYSSSYDSYDSSSSSDSGSSSCD